MQAIVPWVLDRLSASSSRFCLWVEVSSAVENVTGGHNQLMRMRSLWCE